LLAFFYAWELLMPLRIGKIEYANCVPLFGALESLGDKHHCFVHGVPAKLNAMLSCGEIDLSPSSSIVYGVAPERYWLIPDLSISACGPVKSVLLFSRIPIEDLNGATVGLTNESDTSVALIRIILSKFFGFKNEFVRTDMLPQAAMNRFQALLLIGDQAMRESLRISDHYIYDLGELWQKFTGLPFVYALWVVNRHSVAGRESQVVELARTLHKAKLVSRNTLSSYVKGSGLEWYGEGALISYWQTISYDLGEAEIEGVTTFYRHAAEIGIIDKAPELLFFPLEISDWSV
jgi:chorismate dehydratase